MELAVSTTINRAIIGRLQKGSVNHTSKQGEQNQQKAYQFNSVTLTPCRVSYFCWDEPHVGLLFFPIQIQIKKNRKPSLTFVVGNAEIGQVAIWDETLATLSQSTSVKTVMICDIEQ